MKSYFKIILVIAMVLVVGFSVGLTKSKKNAWLGVYIDTVDDILAKDLDLPVKSGVYISKVMRDSAADEAGLKKEDILISFNGEKLFDVDDLYDMIDDSDPGDEVKFELYRDGKKMTLSATLENRSSSRSGRRFYGSGNSYYSSPKVLSVPRVPSAPRAPKAPVIVSTGHGLGNYFTIGGSGLSDRAYMGVNLTNLSRQLGEHLGVKRGRGVLISSVEEDSPAEEAGLLAGDVIIGVDKDKIVDSEDLIEVLHDYDSGDKITVKIIRDKAEKEVALTLGEYDDYNLSYIDVPYIDIDLSDLNGNWIFNDHNSRDYTHWNSFEDNYEDAIEEYMDELEEYEEKLDDLDGQVNTRLKRQIEKYLKNYEDFKEEAQDLDDLSRGQKRDMERLEKSVEKLRKRIE